MDQIAIITEKKRLESLLNKANVSKQHRETLAPIIDNLSWQRVKLDETREQMKEENLTCEYNNGGNQTGIRENPIFKAYVNLWRAYMIGFEKYTSYLPKEFQEEAGEKISVLEQVRKMKEQKA